jgi:hypothetical protein
MPTSGKLLAWITPRGEHRFIAAFVGAAAAHLRPPATQVCASCVEAKRWIEDQAAAFGLPIEWMGETPTG